MQDWAQYKPDLKIFGVPECDPGWLYLTKHGDLYKIGKTRSPNRRMKDARTWNPDIELIAMKPFWNISHLEQLLHEGLADCWHKGEWFRFYDDDLRDFFVEGFCEFYEKDRNANSVDFIYWYNGSGMMEFQMERDARKASLRAFQRQLKEESASRSSNRKDS